MVDEKKEAFKALETLESIAHLNLHGSVETSQFECVDTIRAALTAQEQIDALYGTIKSQKQTHDALIKMNTELLEALKEVRDAIRTEGVLNSMKYDELGVKVYQAIARKVKIMNNELLPCPFKDCHGTMEYHEDDYNNGYLCPECEGWVMPCLKNLEAHANKAVPDGWQDISTAPKDGTEVILSKWSGSYATPETSFCWAINGYFKDGYWYSKDPIIGKLAEPTHWMPLPQPPKEGD